METTSIHERTGEREQLRKCELSRRDPQRREYFWDGGNRWQRCLERLIQRETASDDAYQHQIDEARLGSETQVSLEEHYFSAIVEDIGWYRDFLAYLQSVHAQWQADQTASRKDLEELAGHCLQIEQRMLDRMVRYRQVEL